MKYLILLICCITTLHNNIKAQACEDLPGRFDTYQAAINAIRSADFSYTDEMPEGSNAWIITAEYFSCDGNFGYFICTTSKGGGYIYESVPKDVWAEFKHANNKAQYYDKQVKTKFKLLQTTDKE